MRFHLTFQLFRLKKSFSGIGDQSEDNLRYKWV